MTHALFCGQDIVEEQVLSKSKLPKLACWWIWFFYWSVIDHWSEISFGDGHHSIKYHLIVRQFLHCTCLINSIVSKNVSKSMRWVWVIRVSLTSSAVVNFPAPPTAKLPSSAPTAPPPLQQLNNISCSAPQLCFCATHIGAVVAFKNKWCSLAHCWTFNRHCL